MELLFAGSVGIETNLRREYNMAIDKKKLIVFLVIFVCIMIFCFWLGKIGEENKAELTAAKQEACNELGMKYIKDTTSEYCVEGNEAHPAVIPCNTINKQWECKAYLVVE